MKLFLTVSLAGTAFPALAQSSGDHQTAEQPQPGREVQCQLGTKGNPPYYLTWYFTDPAPVYSTHPNEMLAQLRTWAANRGISLEDADDCYYMEAGRRLLTAGPTTSVSGNPLLFVRLAVPDGWSKPGWTAEGDAGNLLTETKRRPLVFKSVSENTGLDQGYTSAAIDMAYRFMVCAGEIHFAYSLERQSLRHSARYVLREDLRRNHGDWITPDSEPPAPLTFPLSAEIETASYPPRVVARVEDAIAGEALGMGCFTGQSKKIGTVAELVGPAATPQQAKAFLETLQIRYMNDIPFALTHPRPVDPAIAAAREEQRQAEQQAREERDRVALRAQAEAIYREMMASGQKDVAVDALVYPFLQQLIAEGAARQDAEYQAQMAVAAERDRRHEAEMAAWRASVAESERKQAEWRAEVCRIDSSRCTSD